MLLRDPFYRKPIDILSFHPDPGAAKKGVHLWTIPMFNRNIIFKSADDVFPIAMFFTWVCLKVWWTRMMLGKHALAAKRLVQLRSLDKWFRDELHSQPGSILGTAQQWCGLVWGELCTHQVCGGVLQYHVIHPHVDRIPLGSLPMLQIRTGSALLLVLVGYRCRWHRKRGIPWHPTSNWWCRLGIQHFASSEFKPILMAL